MKNKYYEDVKEVKELVDENLCYANGRMTPTEFINFIIAQKYNYNKNNCTITFKFAAIMTIYLATGTVWYDGTINKKRILYAQNRACFRCN